MVNSGDLNFIYVSPNNRSGSLGFKYLSSMAKSIIYCSTEETGVTFFDAGKDYILIHDSVKTWPKDTKYETVEFKNYNLAYGEHKRELQNNSK